LGNSSVGNHNFISGSGNGIILSASDGNAINGVGNVINGTYNFVAGNGNGADGIGNIVSGVNNVLFGNYGCVFGDNNNTSNNNIYVFGSSISAAAANTTYVEDLRLWNKNSVYYKSSATNPTAGTVTLVAGSATVNTTSVQTSSIILLTVQGGTLTNVGAQHISARTAGTSFTISSLNVLDTSTVGWVIIGTY
jgi:hypothetical protein